MSAPPDESRARTARKKLRPIRPKPLMPTRTVTGCSLVGVAGVRSPAGLKVTGVQSPALRAYRPLYVWMIPCRGSGGGAPSGGARGRSPRVSGLVGQHLRRQRRLGVGDAEL